MTGDLEDRLTSAAVLLDTPEKFRSVRAGVRSLVTGIAPQSLPPLICMLHLPPDTPPAFRPRSAEPARSFAWSLIWQETVCEVFYLCREAGLPALREAAFRGEGETAALAFSLLCRLAAGGGRSEEFLEDVRREFQSMPPQAQVFAVETLRSQGIRTTGSTWGQARPDPKFAALLVPLQGLPGCRQAEERRRALEGEQK